MTVAPSGASRAPLPPEDVERARRTGRLAGAVLGAGAGMLGAAGLGWLMGPDLVWLLLGGSGDFGFVGGSPFGDPLAGLRAPWTATGLVLGIVLGLGGPLLAVALLRDWGLGRAAGIAVAGALLAALPVHLANVAVTPLVRTIAIGEDGTLSVLGLAAGALVGALIGAVAGAPAWHWMASVTRPRA